MHTMSVDVSLVKYLSVYLSVDLYLPGYLYLSYYLRATKQGPSKQYLHCGR